MAKPKGDSFWFKDTPSGATRYRTRTKLLLMTSPLVLVVLTYLALTLIDGLEKGSDIILLLAYGIIILVVSAILLVVIISIIDYLRRFE